MDKHKQIDLLTTRIEATNRRIIQADKAKKENLLKKLLHLNDCLAAKRRLLICELKNGRAA